MEIKFISITEEIDEPGFYLIKAGWNDWWEYEVAYQLYYVTADYRKHIGNLKIGRKGFEENYKSGELVVQIGKYVSVKQ